MSLSVYYKSIQKSKENRNYFAQLAGVLILIDICSEIEYPEIYKLNERYKEWVKKFYLTDLPDDLKNNYLDEVNIWFLRNSVLHHGSSNPSITENYSKFGKEKTKVNDIIPALFAKEIDMKVMAAATPTRSEKYPDLFFDVNYFCESIINSVKKWESQNKELVSKSSHTFFKIAISHVDPNNPEQIRIFRHI